MARFALGLLVVAALAAPAAADVLLDDNFSSPAFTSGDLAGQQGWAQLGASATAPIQIAGGRAVIPGIASGGSTQDNQDIYKSFSLVSPPASGTTSVYAGLTLRVDSAGSNPSYFLAMSDTSTGFANERVAARGNANNTFSLGARVTGQAGFPYAFGGDLTYGQDYTVVVEAALTAGAQNDVIRLFVAPTGTPLDMSTPYATGMYSGSGSGTDPVGLGVLILAQFASSTVSQAGLSIGAVRVATTFAEAAAVPEPASIALVALGALPLAALARRRARRA